MAGPSSAVALRVARDARTRALSFGALFFAVVWANAAGYKSTYPHLEDRVKLVANFADNKAARMLYGVGHALVTVGGYTAWRAGGLLALFAGLFGIFAAARAMRGEEDAGRAELVLAGALTRTGAFVATLTGIAVTLAGLWVATTLAALAGGLPLRGSCFFALALLAVATVYAAVGAVANQVFPTRRGALGVSAGVLGVDFLLRIVADTTDHFSVHWCTPLGWAEEMRAFSGSRAIVVVLPIASTLVLVVGAGILHARRDVGGAYVAPHDTAAARTGLLSSPLALAVRLDRVTIASWVFSIATFAFVVGTVAKSVEKLELPQSVRDQIAKLGGIDITRAKGYVSLTFVIFVFAIGLFVCGQFAAARDEETTHRLETLFALPYGRARWLQGRVMLIVVATAACAMAAGAAAGLGVLVTGGHMTFGQGLEAGVNVLPIELFFIGAGVFFVAFAPRLGVGFLYALVVVAFVWDLFGALLGFPDWLLDVSPYRHVAPAPAKPIAVVAALLMIAIGAGATMAGVARFRRRDLAGD
jgi:ABC-2 type transport system permease protein